MENRNGLYKSNAKNEKKRLLIYILSSNYVIKTYHNVSAFK